jgi:hypothetical protein
MPKFLVIILVVVVWGIWSLAKTQSNSVDQAAKSYDDAAAKKKASRFAKRRETLRQHIHVSLPDELDSFHKKFEVVRTDFERIQKVTNALSLTKVAELFGPPSVPRLLFMPLLQRKAWPSVSPGRVAKPTTEPLLFTALAVPNVPPKVPRSVTV